MSHSSSTPVSNSSPVLRQDGDLANAGGSSPLLQSQFADLQAARARENAGTPASATRPRAMSLHGNQSWATKFANPTSPGRRFSASESSSPSSPKTFSAMPSPTVWGRAFSFLSAHGTAIGLGHHAPTTQSMPTLQDLGNVVERVGALADAHVQSEFGLPFRPATTSPDASRSNTPSND